MNEKREIPEGEDNEMGQGATNVHKDKGKPPLPPNAGSATRKGKSFHARVILFLSSPQELETWCYQPQV
nr:hypothetical protein CFP56_42739 [Quercus suber]